MARPAGLSSDEDNFSDDNLSFGDSPPPQRSTWLNSRVTNNKNISKEKELINAVMDNNITQVEKLLNEGVDVKMNHNALGEWDALMHACSLGLSKVVKLLLDHGANPNCHYELFTPIMALCDSTKFDEEELLQCFEVLVESGANICAQDWYHTNPLMHAVKRSHQKLVLKLLSLGVNVNDIDKDGWSPLFYAVDSGDLNIVQILKDIGGDITLTDKRGRSLYDIAIMKDFKEISEVVSLKEKIPSVEEVIKKRQGEKLSSSYRQILTELPDKKRGRFSGFPTDAIKIIHGIGLNNLTSLFFENNVQLGELLTNTDQQWKELGIVISFDRAKLRYSVQKFHERHWGKLSLGTCMNKDDITLFSVAQLLSNVVRQAYVLSTTTYYLNINVDHQTSGIMKYVDKGLSHLDQVEKELLSISAIVKKIGREQNIVPVDLIRPKPKRGYLKYMMVSCLVCGLLLYNVKFVKRNPWAVL